MSLDLDEYRLRDLEQWKIDRATPSPFPRPHRLRGQFLRPLPWSWIAPAVQLPGAAPRVALLLARQAGLQQQSTNVRIPSAALREFTVSPRAYYRALVELEAAGLVVVTRRPGCRARITMVPI